MQSRTAFSRPPIHAMPTSFRTWKISGWDRLGESRICHQRCSATGGLRGTAATSRVRPRSGSSLCFDPSNIRDPVPCWMTLRQTHSRCQQTVIIDPAQIASPMSRKLYVQNAYARQGDSFGPFDPLPRQGNGREDQLHPVHGGHVRHCQHFPRIWHMALPRRRNRRRSQRGILMAALRFGSLATEFRQQASSRRAGAQERTRTSTPRGAST